MKLRNSAKVLISLSFDEWTCLRKPLIFQKQVFKNVATLFFDKIVNQKCINYISQNNSEFNWEHFLTVKSLHLTDCSKLHFIKVQLHQDPWKFHMIFSWWITPGSSSLFWINHWKLHLLFLQPLEILYPQLSPLF